MDYQTLRNMARQLDGAKIAAAGQLLMSSAKMLQDATMALFVKRGDVVWTGPAAEQFGTWTQNLTNSTFQLADFVHNQGKRLADLGSEVTTAVARIPEVSTETLEQHAAMVANPAPTLPHDAGATSTALTETDKVVREAQAEAAAQMRIVAQTYEGTTHVMLLEPRPEFQPPNDVYGVQRDPHMETFGADGGGAGTTAAGVASRTSLAGSSSGSPAKDTASPVTPNGVVSSVTSGHPGTGVSSGVTASASGANVVQVPATPIPPQAAPVTHLTTVPQVSSGQPTSPALSVPVDTSVESIASTGVVTGGFGGARASGASGMVGRTTATPRLPMGGQPSRPPQGIVGGTPRPGQMPSEGHVGGARPGMPMGGGVAGPAPITSGGTAGRSASGRPVGGVPGGVVGGTSTPNTPGNRRQFTPGGSGLRSRDTSSGVPGQATGGSAQGRPVGVMQGGAVVPPTGARGRRERADYLTEDDEYWNGRRNDGVPPVIG